MKYLFSPEKKFTTWRKLWIALAESEKELGLDITDEQIDELKAHASDINYDVAKEREKVVRHDVMSHVYAYGRQCPKAKGIIHLGATSCYVGDNTDLIIMKEGLDLVKAKLVNVIAQLAKFAEEYKDLPTLGFTHFQAAQPTTVGKRATLWMNDLVMDLGDIEYLQSTIKLLGSKGTTGTQATFLELFDGDHSKVKSSIHSSRRRWVTRRATRYRDRHIQGKWIRESSTYSRASRKARTNSRMIYGCFRISKKSKSHLKNRRSVHRRWHTRETLCVQSAWQASRIISSATL